MSIKVSAVFATANIQNFPDMTVQHVNEDHNHVLRRADVILWQETAEKADYESIIRAGKLYRAKSFETTRHQNECPITWNNNVFHRVGRAESIKMSPGLGPGSKSPARYLTRLVLKSVKYPNFPAVEIHNTHYIQNAWNAKHVPEKAERKQQWNIEWKKQRDLVLAAHHAGRIVIFGGDWNRNGDDIPKFSDSQKWVIAPHAGLDHVGILVPDHARVSVRNPFVIQLNSDHNAKGAELVLSAVNKKQ